MSNLLRELTVHPGARPFAILHRAGGPGVEVLVGDIIDVNRLSDIPLPEAGSGPSVDVLALVPYRQITERGFRCHDDGAPLRCLLVRDAEVLTLEEALALLPDGPLEVTGGGFDLDDNAYASTVKEVIDNQIGRGAGANFVIRRDYRARTAVPAPLAALRLLQRLLISEPGAYWKFAVHGVSVRNMSPAANAVVFIRRLAEG